MGDSLRDYYKQKYKSIRAQDRPKKFAAEEPPGPGPAAFHAGGWKRKKAQYTPPQSQWRLNLDG